MDNNLMFNDGVSVSGEICGYAYVDLGLKSGLKWATCNVGASKPTEFGDYFAWGETCPKNDYSWKTYKWCLDDHKTQTKYCTLRKYGDVDNKVKTIFVVDALVITSYKILLITKSNLKK